MPVYQAEILLVIFRSEKLKLLDVFFITKDYVISYDLRKHLDWLLNKIAPSKEALEKLQSYENVTMGIDCVWRSLAGHGGPVLWSEQMKTTIDGKQYAQIGDKLYSQHAVDRMQPSGLGSPAGTVGAGRNISPCIVEHTIQNGTSSIVNGVERTVHWSSDVGVVT